jgi:N-formylglutamate deformylase
MAVPSHNLRFPEVQSTAVIFASPHSGRYYHDNFLNRSVLDKHTLRSSEDAFVDDLVSQVTKFGAPFLKAVMPRAYVDLNRGPDELDPVLISGIVNRSKNNRISSGLGVIPRVVGHGKEIYKGKISQAEAEIRILNYWRPYHLALKKLMTETHRKFGTAILIDCHSMPTLLNYSRSIELHNMPDIILGDQFGASAEKGIVDKIESIFVREGFNVGRNIPFSGAFITKEYGFPPSNRHALQVEIRRSLYMEEDTLCLNKNFHYFKDVFGYILGQIAKIGEVSKPIVGE